MRSQSEALLTRRNITLTESTVSQLSDLKSWTWAGSDSEVLRQALLYFEQWMADLFEGTELWIAYADREREVAGVEASVASGGTAVQAVKRNLMLPEPAAERIEALREATGASSDSEVLRSAISLYHFLVRGIMEGGKLVTRHKDGSEHMQADIPVAQKKREIRRPKIGIRFSR